MIINIYIELSSKRPATCERKWGYVLECLIKGEPVTRQQFGTAEGTYNGVTLQAINEALSHVKQGNEIHIYTQNAFILSMIEQHLEKWSISGFRNAKGGEIANAAEWERLQKLAEGQLLISEPGPHAYTNWLQGEMA